METVFKKWWVILIQGILLVIIGFIFFNNPTEVLTAISFSIGLLNLVAGGAGLIAYFTSSKEEKDGTGLLWSLGTLLLGILLLTKLGFTMKMVTIFFGIWILLTGIWLLSAGWAHLKDGAIAWLTLVGGILSIIAGIAIVFNMYTGAVWISTLLGIQAIVAGIAMIVLALAKKKVVKQVKDRLST